MRSDLPYYVLAVLLGLAAGLLEVRMEDLLVTALFVIVSTMVLGFLRPKWPWRWTAIVGLCIPLVRFWAYAFHSEQANRAQIWEAGLGFLTGIAGAYCGSFTHKVIHELFYPNREQQP
jgi:lysylphosphatidylglycerol synthetase-like protein (DUF2156 family)